MYREKYVSAMILAAGMSHRMGSEVNKQFIIIGGKPILAHAIEKFQASRLVDEIVVVGRESELSYIEREIVKKYGFTKVINVVQGGPERHDSAFRGLIATSDKTDIILSHDGARPFVSLDIIERTIIEAYNKKAAIAGVPVKDTVKFVSSGTIIKTPDRKLIWNAQTPQAFDKELLLLAYKEAFKRGITETDDASIVENFGQEVSIVMGAYENIKITTPDDVILGEALHFYRERHGDEKCLGLA